MRRLMVVAGLVLATLAGGGGSPRPAHAVPPPPPPPPPTLTNEHFGSLSQGNNNTVDCTPIGPDSFFGTATFEATGTALGPYEGAFRERGSVSFTEQTVDFSARFSIESELGTVVGTFFDGGHGEDGEDGVCEDFPESAANDDVAFFRSISLTYEAAIVTPDRRTFTDEGVLAVRVMRVTEGTETEIDEDFQSSQPQVIAVDCFGTNISSPASTSGNNVLIGTPALDDIDGLAGNDRICGLSGDDALAGGRGNDRVRGGNGNDLIDGGLGNDTLRGEGGDDTLVGGPGRDLIVSGNHDDVIRSADGAIDQINCGPGSDTVEADSTDTIAPNCENVTIVP